MYYEAPKNDVVYELDLGIAITMDYRPKSSIRFIPDLNNPVYTERYGNSNTDTYTGTTEINGVMYIMTSEKSFDRLISVQIDIPLEIDSRFVDLKDAILIDYDFYNEESEFDPSTRLEAYELKLYYQIMSDFYRLKYPLLKQVVSRLDAISHNQGEVWSKANIVTNDYLPFHLDDVNNNE